MKCNMVPMDAAIRGSVGLLLLASPILNLHTYPYSLLGVVPMVTGLFSYCPLYAAVRSLLPVRSHGSSSVPSAT